MLPAGSILNKMGFETHKPEIKSPKIEWNPFRSNLLDISCTAVEGSRDEINFSIIKLQNRLRKYIKITDIKETEFDQKFNAFLSELNINISLNNLSDYVYEITEKLKNDLKGSENIESQEMVEKLNANQINKLVAYEKILNTISIHILPNRTTSISEKLKLFKEGFQKLAEIVNSDSSIEHIKGWSWIVKEHPELIKKLGFNIDINFSNKLKSIIGKDNEGANLMTIERKDFLDRYLQTVI